MTTAIATSKQSTQPSTGIRSAVANQRATRTFVSVLLKALSAFGA